MGDDQEAGHISYPSMSYCSNRTGGTHSDRADATKVTTRKLHSWPPFKHGFEATTEDAIMATSQNAKTKRIITKKSFWV
jgi:hypothetical protein